MSALGIDLGATKMSFAVFSQHGDILHKQSVHLEKRAGKEVADLMIAEVQVILALYHSVSCIGIAVPGIYHVDTGTVWAPNIEGWDDYPLKQHIKSITHLPVTIDSDRAASILGESWFGNAKGCRHAIYLAVGTGIGAGIMIDGKILRGAHDIAGAIGWLALQPPFEEKYVSCGCFEYHASGDGIAKVAREVLTHEDDYNGLLREKAREDITAHDVFSAYDNGDPIAKDVFDLCIRFWGMAVANLVSLFNPEKIILGGGVFGPAVRFIDEIRSEASKWAQPVSMKLVKIEPSALGTDAALYGAGLLAFSQKSGA